MTQTLYNNINTVEKSAKDKEVSNLMVKVYDEYVSRFNKEHIHEIVAEIMIHGEYFDKKVDLIKDTFLLTTEAHSITSIGGKFCIPGLGIVVNHKHSKQLEKLKKLFLFWYRLKQLKSSLKPRPELEPESEFVFKCMVKL
tara:strand:- start:399 stop:818 length:420 start_codon:yes stop_codon:yes gene_type:complete